MIRALIVVCLVVSATASSATAQTADAALRDRVAQLVAKLDAAKSPDRDAAEAALVKLGAKILPLLPDAKKLTAEQKTRLDRVRNMLREAAAAAVNLGPAKITLQGKSIRLSEAIQALQKQSGNVLNDLREQEGQEATNPVLDLDVVDKTFLEAVDMVATKAGVATTYTTGDGSVGLMMGAVPTKYVQYLGPFRVLFKQITVGRDFQADSQSCNVAFEVDWEPRLRPMLLALKVDESKIVDDRGKTIEAQVMEESSQVVLRPENPSAEINLNLSAPDRAATKLKQLRVKADVTVPSGLRVFRFEDLSKKNVTRKQGDIEMTLESTEVDEQVWKVSVVLKYPGGGPAFESYRQGLFNNRIWLEKSDGSRFEQNGGFSNTSADNGTLGFEYLFVDAPGKPSDFGLIYETPSKLETIPLIFEFNDVPLP